LFYYFTIGTLDIFLALIIIIISINFLYSFKALFGLFLIGILFISSSLMFSSVLDIYTLIPLFIINWFLKSWCCENSAPIDILTPTTPFRLVREGGGIRIVCAWVLY